MHSKRTPLSLSHTDEARPGVFLAAPVSGLDDLALGERFLVSALAVIDWLRAAIAKLVETPNQDHRARTSLPSANNEERAGRPGHESDDGVAGYTARELSLPFADVTTSGTLVPRAMVGPAVVSSHMWDDSDVEYELQRAREQERAAGDRKLPGEYKRAVLDMADWHRSRALAIADLIRASDAAEGWFTAEWLRARIPTRSAAFHGGPFDGAVLTVQDPPRTFFVAHREDGDALAQSCLVHEITIPHDSADPPRPRRPRSGGSVIGWYAFDPDHDRYGWRAVRTR